MTLVFVVWPFCTIFVIRRKNQLLYHNQMDHAMICIGYTSFNMETREQCALK